MKTYTRTGDDGSTSLQGGRKVSKNHIRVEAYGTVDELIAWTGLLIDFPENLKRKKTLAYIRDQLMRCAASLAVENRKPVKDAILPEPECVRFIEDEIDVMESVLKPLKSFLLPGGNMLVSWCNIARCVCRRAERRAVQLNETEKIPEIIIPFLNRLSDYYFVLTRILCLELDIKEVKWSV
ncbi:MAG: cob(I)yrinic acid a,c-diamide adenosyltransferase [Bacteroidota bacterium]